MVCNWVCGVPVRALCRCWFQLPIASWQSSIASSDREGDSTLPGTLETVADRCDYSVRIASFRVDNRADVVEGARQFHLYRLHRPEPGRNRSTMARVSERRQQLLLISARACVRRVSVGSPNAGKRHWVGFARTTRS